MLALKRILFCLRCSCFYPFALAFLLLGLSGCQSREVFEEPRLHLVNIKVESIKLLEQKFILYLQVDNPNRYPLSFRRISYRLWLNDMELGSGQIDKRFSVPGKNSRRLEVPLHTNIWQHLKPLSAALKTPQNPLHYRLEGKIKSGWLFGPNLHWNSQGKITPVDYLQGNRR